MYYMEKPAYGDPLRLLSYKTLRYCQPTHTHSHTNDDILFHSFAKNYSQQARKGDIEKRNSLFEFISQFVILDGSWCWCNRCARLQFPVLAWEQDRLPFVFCHHYCNFQLNVTCIHTNHPYRSPHRL